MSNERPEYDNTSFVPIDACMAVIDLMTEEQKESIRSLLRKPTVQRIALKTDSWTRGIAFNLYGNRGPNDCFLTGLILPEGSIHT